MCNKLIVFGAILLLAPRALACDVLVSVESGQVCGVLRWAETGEIYASFRGVPYATQPRGQLRFKELQALEPWDGVYNASTEGPVCPQKDVLFGKMAKPQGMDEACIHANIHVPQDALPGACPKGSTRPILVFIHGGGFQSGSGDADIYGPEYLVTKGVIVITFNYRLNVFGFLSLDSASVPGNQGLRDCVTLLRWVQRNAQAFGGDPHDVTLVGQSAGASNAHLLSLSPAAEGLFKRVILQSGCAISGFYTASKTYAQNMANMLISKLNITSIDPEEIHRQLVNMPLDTIMEAYYVTQDQAGLTAFTPVIESTFPGVTTIINKDPEQLIKEGQGKDIPLIIGFTSAEAYSMQNRVRQLNIVDAIKQQPTILVPPNLLYSFSNDTLVTIADKILREYFKNSITFNKYLDYATDAFFIYPAIKLAQWRAASGGAPVFLYQFSYEAKDKVVQKALGVKYKGAGHIEDLTYVFRLNSALGEHRSFPPKNDDDKMKDWMTNFVINFIKCSHPSCNDTIGHHHHEVWPPVDPAVLMYQDIRRPKAYRVVEPTSQQKKMVQLFDSIQSKAHNVS